MADLSHLLEEHSATPFPAVARGEEYGEIDAVMIDADIYGWCCRAQGGNLREDDRRWLQKAHDELGRSLSEIPPIARPYYARLLTLAEVALAERTRG